MRFCILRSGDIDWQAYRELTTRMPLTEFLDLEELALVQRDRNFAWDVFMANNPKLLRRAGIVRPDDGDDHR